MILTPNAGGDSRISEGVSFQIFNWLCNAVLLKVVLIVYFFFTISCLANETVGEFIIYILKLDSAIAAVFNFDGQAQCNTMKFVIYRFK